MIGYFRNLKSLLSRANIFETDDTSERVVTVQRASTRLYITILSLSMIILIVQHVLKRNDMKIDVESPSLDIYRELQTRYVDVTCPCSKISISYGSFVTLIPVYHQICSSGFVSQEWIDILYDSQTTYRYPGDFRATASTQFQVLREFCRFFQNALDLKIETFYETQFVSANVFIENQWNIEIEAAVDKFLDTNSMDLQNRILFLRLFVNFNLLISGIQTPASLVLQNGTDVDHIELRLNTYQAFPYTGTCGCDDGGACYSPSALYDVDNYDNLLINSWILQSKLIFRLNNWYTGCWATESLLLSSYNASFLTDQTEFNRIASYVDGMVNPELFTILSSQRSNGTNARVIGNFSELLQKSFLEIISRKKNYELYFEQCRPRSCHYWISQHSTFLYIFTSLLSLFGGLSIALRFIIPLFVQLLYHRFTCRNSVTTDKAEHVEAPVEHDIPSSREKLTKFFGWILDTMIKFNMFRSSVRREPLDIQQQVWMTRIYIILLIHGLIIVVFYAMIDVQQQIIQIPNPTLERVLSLQTSSDSQISLQCPCTQINTRYKKLVQLQPYYHQICRSEFAGDRWMWNVRALLQVNMGIPIKRLDFRRSYQIFYLLRYLCSLVDDMVQNALDAFQETELVTGYLLTNNHYDEQMKSIIEKFQSELTANFRRFLQLTRSITYINQYFSNANPGPLEISSSSVPTFSIYNYVNDYANPPTTCFCANDITCKGQFGLYNQEYYSTPKELIPGLYRGCFAFESLYMSTLECFYDNTNCLTKITNFYNNRTSFPRDFILLQSLAPSRFNVSSPIGELLSELFIEYWSQSVNYSEYFTSCQPTFCSYELFRNTNVLEIAAIVLGLIGGLSLSLRIGIRVTVPLIFNVVRHKTFRTQSTPQNPNIVRWRKRILDWLINLNLFDNPNKTTGNNLQERRQMTRIYLITLSIGLSILALYNSLVFSIYRLQVKDLTIEQYDELHELYDTSSLNCPCSQQSINYGSFIDLSCSFHPICYSQFISDSQLQYFFEIYQGLDILNARVNVYTLEATVFSHFKALRILCNLAEDTYKDLRKQYLTSAGIYDSMLGRIVFNEQINSSLSRFEKTLSSEFLRDLRLIGGIFQSNALVSLYSTNWYLMIRNWYQFAKIYMEPQYYSNCNCFTSSSCTQQLEFPVPGYLVGCTPLESLLRSSLQCFYNETCLDSIKSYLNIQSSLIVALNKNETRSAENDTVDSLLEDMFLEKCSSTISYENFFENCKPRSCIITLRARRNTIGVVTILLGLYGGLATALKVLIPAVVAIIHMFTRKHNIIEVNVQSSPNSVE